MNKNLRNRFLLLIGILVLLLAIILSRPGQIIEIILDVNLFYLLLAVGLIFIAYLVQTLRFLVLMRHHDNRLGFFNTFIVLMSSIYFNLITPAGAGDVFARPYILKRLYKTDFKDAFSTVFFERFSDLIILLIVTLGFMWIYILKLNLMLYLLLVFLGILLSLLLFKYLRKITGFIPQRVMKYVDYVLKIRTIPISSILISSIFTLLNFILIISIIYMILLSLNVVPTIVMIGLFLMSFLIGLLSFIPGGLGVLDASVAGLYHMNGFDGSLGMSIALLNRFLYLSTSLVFYIFVLSKIKKK